MTVSHATLAYGPFSKVCIEHRIGYLVADFVRMSFSNGFRSKNFLAIQDSPLSSSDRSPGLRRLQISPRTRGLPVFPFPGGFRYFMEYVYMLTEYGFRLFIGGIDDALYLLVDDGRHFFAVALSSARSRAL